MNGDGATILKARPKTQLNSETEFNGGKANIAEELTVSAEIAALHQTIAELTAKNAQQAAQLNELAGPVEWLALLACDRNGYTSEALRTWCKTGIVESRRVGKKRLFVNTRSLAAHLKRMGLAKAIKSA
jgi:hypothetical protein